MNRSARTMVGSEAWSGIRPNRLLRLHLVELRRSIADQATTVRDAAAIISAGAIAVALLISAWLKLWNMSPEPSYLAGALLAAPIGAGSVLRMRRRRSWMQQHGILHQDALRRDRWASYELAGHLSAFLFAWLPVVVMAMHLGGRPIIAIAVATTATMAAVAAVSVRSASPSRPSTSARAAPARSQRRRADRRDIALSRRLAPMPDRARRWSTLLAVGCLVGLSPALAAAVGVRGQALLACTSALVAGPLLWLTRLDGDLIGAQALAGMRPWVGARDALAPAGAYALAATTGLLAAAAVGAAPYAMAALAAASSAALCVLYVLRSWRMPRLSRRTADTLASVDVAIVVLAAVALSWLAVPVLLLLVWRLHRQATAGLLIS